MRIPALALAIGLAGCTTLPEASRSVLVGDARYTYAAYEGYWARFAEFQPIENDRGFHSGLVITITGRDGMALTEADREGARAAARQVCQASRRQWYEGDAGVFLASGGLSFAGACG